MRAEGHIERQLHLFLFDAFDPQRSSVVRGSWWAHSQQQAEFWLEQQGLTQIRLRLSSRLLEQVQVEPDSLSLFYRQLSLMFRAGMPLSEALRLASYTEDRHLAGVCLLLSDRLKSGYPLSQAMKLFPCVFDMVGVGLIAAAEQSGHLHETLGRLADTEERRLSLRRSLISASIYPLILTLSTLLLAFLFLFYVFPLNRELLGATDAELPWLARVVMPLMDILSSPWSPVLALAFFGLLALQFRSKRFRDRVRVLSIRFLLKVPAVGGVVRKAQALRMLQVLNLILSGGGTVDMALRFMISTASDPAQRALFEEVRDQVIRGADFSLALENAEVFPSLITSLIQVGYETGRMEQMARHGIKLCEEDVRLAVDSASALLEPLLLIFSGLLAGIAIISSALPLLQLLNSL